MSKSCAQTSLREAIAEAEQLVATAPASKTEADLLEGLQYLAGCIAGCMHLAFDYERDHPFRSPEQGPFTKMGLDNPDTLYFGTLAGPAATYNNGQRTAQHHHRPRLSARRRVPTITCPASQAAFSTTVSSTSPRTAAEWRLRPNAPRAALLIRECTALVTTARHAGHRQAGHRRRRAAAALTRELMEKRYATAGSQLANRVKTWI